MSRFVRRVSALACTVAAVVAASATPARADNPSVDITAYRVSNASISAGGCKSVPLTMSATTDPSVTSAGSTTHIYRGTTEVDYDFFEPDVPSTWLWCPYMGLGTFRFGPTDVDWTTASGSYTDVDGTTGYGSVKVRSTQALTGTSRSGSYVTLTARSLYYSLSSSSYAAWSGARVTFQYRLPGTSTWRNAVATTTRSGVASARLYAPSARYWRAVSTQGTTIWGAVSAQVTR